MERSMSNDVYKVAYATGTITIGIATTTTGAVEFTTVEPVVPHVSYLSMFIAAAVWLAVIARLVVFFSKEQ